MTTIFDEFEFMVQKYKRRRIYTILVWFVTHKMVQTNKQIIFLIL